MVSFTFRILFLCIVFLCSASNATEAVFCDGILAGNLDPIDAALENQSGFRQLLLSRIRYPGDLEFNVPEYRPFVVDALNQLTDLQRRTDTAPTSANPVNLIKRYLLIKRKITSLRSEIEAMLASHVTYWATLKLSFEFTKLVDMVLEVEGKRDWRDRSNKRAVDLKELEKIGQVFPVVFVPSFRPISIPEINRIFSRGILPLGVITQTEFADGDYFGSKNYLIHDLDHAKIFLYSLFASAFPNQQTPNLSEMSRESRPRLEASLRKSETEMTVFFNKLSLLAEKKLKDGVEFSFFTLDHEYGSMISYSGKKINFTQADIIVGLGLLNTHNSNVSGDEFPRNLPGAEERIYWSHVLRWLNENWTL